MTAWAVVGLSAPVGNHFLWTQWASEAGRVRGYPAYKVPPVMWMCETMTPRRINSISITTITAATVNITDHHRVRGGDIRRRHIMIAVATTLMEPITKTNLDISINLIHMASLILPI